MLNGECYMVNGELGAKVGGKRAILGIYCKISGQTMWEFMGNVLILPFVTCL